MSSAYRARAGHSQYLGQLEQLNLRMPDAPQRPAGMRDDIRAMAAGGGARVRSRKSRVLTGT